MENTSNTFLLLSHAAALGVIQQAIRVMANWVDAELPQDFHPPNDNEAIAKAKKLLSWQESGTIQPLRVLFDRINLSQGQTQEHYWHPEVINLHYIFRRRS